jgi:hypothetical protein
MDGELSIGEKFEICWASFDTANGFAVAIRD